MKIQHPKVSILMPSLNSAEFIRECLDSVVNQTLQDIEIICIDAGSTDGTLEILHEYERKDDRVRVILSDKKSMGYQYNMGLDAAVGDYIGMVETDDWVETNTFESLWMVADRQNVDIVAANHYFYYTKPEIRNQPFENLHKCPYEQVFCPKDVLSSFSVTPLIWSGIYRRSMLKENGIRFNETPGASFQDTGFHFMVMTAAKTVFFLNKYFYHYRRDNAAQSINSGGKVFCICDEARHYEKFLEKRPADRARLLKPYMAWKYDKYYWNYTRVEPQFQWVFLLRFREEFLAHRNAGLLEGSGFETSAFKVTLEKFNELIDNPVSFYKQTCKKYCTFPKEGELLKAEVLKESSCVSPDISIILPLYNKENCVAGSLENLRKQTLENIEIICVDDGSDDATLKILMELAKADGRLTVLHQGNQGNASAKNIGLEYARGRYVAFVNGGDRLLETAAERLVALADKQGLDMICFDSVPLSAKNWDNSGVNKESREDNVITGLEYYCSAYENGTYNPFAGTALFKRQYLMRRNIRFVDGIFYEDRVFMFSALSEAGHVLHLAENLYFTDDSRSFPLKRIFLRVYSYFVIYQLLLQKCQSLPYDKKLQNTVARELETVCDCLKELYRSVNKKEECRSRFSATESCLLEKLIGNEADF